MATVSLPYDAPHSHPPNPDRGSPGVLLTVHLNDVGSRAEQLTSRGEDEIIHDIARITGELHDFGKVTPFFQFYIAGRTLKPESLKNHSPLGSLAVYHVLEECGYGPELALVGLIAVAKHHGVLPDVVEYATETSLGDERQELLGQQIDAIDRFPSTAETADTILEQASDHTTDWATFRDAFRNETLKTTIEDRLTARMDQLDLSACSSAFYGRIMQVWGALVIADKTSAAGIGTNAYDSTHMHSSSVADHITKLQAEAEANAGPEGLPPELEELNRQRDQACESIVANGRTITNATDGGWVGEITLPTGLGKTLAALDLAHTIGEQRDEDTRIIYALPYTSIIDQTATVIEEVFGVDKTTNELTIHHHLEEVVTELEHYVEERTQGYRDPDEYADEEYLAAKGWNSGMTLTTFVQLFESLIRPNNQQAMKLPALYNSVIILDEPQTLPLDWWRLIRRVVQTLIEEYDATVISMTATQPRILTADTCPFKVHELVDEPDQYFELVERVEYQYHPTLEAYLDDPDADATFTHDEAGETVVGNLSAGEPTGLAICNTVASAIALTNAIDAAAAAADYEQISLGEVYAPLARRDDATFEPEGDEDGEEETLIECRARALLEALEMRLEGVHSPLVALHLTTRHRPIDRKVLLEAASRLSEKRETPFVFVATQLVEAGVDVSFTRVYRDFAPISSIVQAAGRCNRSAERNRGTVTIWRLKETDGADRLPSELVYAFNEYNKLGPTARALNEVAPARPADGSARTVRELAVAHEGVQEYYRILDEERDVGRQEYVDWVDTALFKQLRSLSLIDERPAFDVLVCRSHEEHNRGKRLLKALDNQETAVAYEQFSALEETQVSLPESEVHGEIPRDARPAVFGGRLVFVVDVYVGEGNFLPRMGLRG